MGVGAKLFSFFVTLYDLKHCCIYKRLCEYTPQAFRCLQRPAEGAGYRDAGVTGFCEPLGTVLGSFTKSTMNS